MMNRIFGVRPFIAPLSSGALVVEAVLVQLLLLVTALTNAANLSRVPIFPYLCFMTYLL
jgi:hypothetical protein